MQRPPRDIAVDRLVSMPLLLYAYLTMGIAESIACVISYLWTFLYNDVSLSNVWLVDPKKDVWSVREEINKEDVAIGNGRILGPEEQARIVREVRRCSLCGDNMKIKATFMIAWTLEARASTSPSHSMLRGHHPTSSVTIGTVCCVQWPCVYRATIVLMHKWRDTCVGHAALLFQAHWIERDAAMACHAWLWLSGCMRSGPAID
jgi:hypothetical protein